MHTGNIILSSACGFFFAVAWWLFVDGVSIVDASGDNAGPFYLYVPGIMATIGLFLMANLPAHMFSKEDTGEDTTVLQKVILVLSIICMLAGIITAVWTYIEKKSDRNTSNKQWRGASTIVQSILISMVSFAWAFLYKDPNGF